MRNHIIALSNKDLTNLCFEYLSLNQEVLAELKWRKKNGLITKEIGIKYVDQAK